MSEINSILIAILCCSIAFILYMQLNHSSNINNKGMKKYLVVLMLCLGFIANIQIAAVFSIIFLPLYIDDVITNVKKSFREGYEYKQYDSFDEALSIANDEPQYDGRLNFPNYDEDMSRFKVG